MKQEPSPRPPRGGSVRTPWLLGALGLALATACHSAPERAAFVPWSDLDRDVRPTLEEVFLEPPLFGTPPTVDGLSADGRWLLVDWDPPGPQLRAGADAPDSAPATLRVLGVEHDRPAASGAAGVPLADRLGLVPERSLADESGDDDEEHEPDRIRATTWSHRGARLAFTFGPDVYLWDANANALAHVAYARAIPEEPADEQEDGADDDEASEAPPEPPKIARLAFARADDALRLWVGDELYVLDLVTLPSAPLAIDTLENPTANLTAAARQLRFSDDLRVAFGHSPTPRATKDVEAALELDEGDQAESLTQVDEENEDEAQSDAAVVQVVHLADDRGVTLEGMADAQAIERVSLSPDGRFVFAADYDRETEPAPTLVPDYLTERVTASQGRRLLAEDGPSPFRLWMWETDAGTRSELLAEEIAENAADSDASADDDARREGPWWLRTIGWAPQETPDAPARFAFERNAWDYHEREVWVWSEAGTRRVWSEHDDAWVGGPAAYSTWSADGTRLLIGSESTTAETTTPGRCQLFSVDVATGDTVQLTEVGGEVARFRSLPDGAVLVEARDADRARRSLFLLSSDMVAGRVAPNARRFPTPPGTSSDARASRDGARVVFSFESLFAPAELWTADAHSAAPLTATTPDAYDSVDWIEPVRVSTQSVDGRTIFAHVFLPPGTSLDAPGPPRATIVFVHGAGYLQNVTDSMTRYPLNLMFHSRLARLGYPVVDVDYRGSAGYGRDFRTDVQYHLGGKDLDDIHSVLDLLIERGVVDRERVGVYGGSYGGFMTLMALFTAPERWAVGAALRSVTDWRTYHPTYTQPRLGRPSTHPDAYARSSPLDLVAGAADPVLILHGMVDSNVFAQDSIRLIEALIDQGSEFDAMLYPSQGHGFEDGPHWLDEYRRIERYLLGHLGPPITR